MIGHVVAVLCLAALLLLAAGLVVIHRINATTRTRGEALDARMAGAESRLAQLLAAQRRPPRPDAGHRPDVRRHPDAGHRSSAGQHRAGAVERRAGPLQQRPEAPRRRTRAAR